MYTITILSPLVEARRRNTKFTSVWFAVAVETTLFKNGLQI
jgi:hypothetical protein